MASREHALESGGTPRRRSWIGRLLVASAALGAAAGLGAVLGYQSQVLAPDPRFEREALLAVVAQETPVYYADGVTRLGVFFGDEHRTYVPWESIPLAWVVSIVAAEDQRFWSHPGLDWRGISRAAVHNAMAGRVVSGGSTLTQQTVKNLFYRPDRSLRAKADEALNALRLEARYPKTEILEFYANQFHVTGNGRGLGVAARHLFDKELERAEDDPSQRLSLAEAAYLAGYVKGPSNYDPHRGDAARRDAARARGLERTRYVLGRVVETPAETLAGFAPGDPDALARVQALQDEARALLARPADDDLGVAFRKGAFRFPSDAVLDEVRRRLRESPRVDLLERHGGEDLESAGLKVVTTLDVTVQRAAVYALRHHLSEIGTMVEGLGLDAWRSDGPAPSFDPDRVPMPREVRRAVVSARAKDSAGRTVLDLDLGGHACRVDRDGLVRVAAAVERGRTGRPWDKVGTAAVDAVAEGLPAGTVVMASVRSVGDGGAQCDLEAEVSLQGAVVVTEDGALRAMVGGRDNRDYNRAKALRQFGSTWKMVALHTAMGLGWSTVDLLDNRRGLFPYSAGVYGPSPDHEGQDQVSLAWAGVRSENLATVWLVYHLLDRLDVHAVARLGAVHGLARQAGESDADWTRRLIRRGIDLSSGAIEEARFLAARDEVAAGLRAGGRHPEDRVALMSLQHGRPLRRAGGVPEDVGAWASAWASRTLWDEVLLQRDRCADAWADAVQALSLGRLPLPSPDIAVSFRPVGDGGADGSEDTDTDAGSSTHPTGLEMACGDAPEGFGPWDPAWSVVRTPRPRGGLLANLFGAAQPLPPPALVEQADVVLDGLHLGTIDAVAQAVTRRRMQDETLDEAPSVLDDRVLYALQDVRVLLALEELVATAHRYGVRSELDEVLSLPLGAREITLEEATVLYDGLTSGQVRRFPGLEAGTPPKDVPPPRDPALLIREVRNVDDRVLYRARTEAERVDEGPAPAGTWTILEGVVAHGTGQRAKRAVPAAEGTWLPLAGKTGTTNDFRNAAFVGRAPHLDDDGRLGQGLVVGVYVGFDDNRRMVHRAVRLAGSSGALPVWTEVVQGLAAAGLLGPTDAVAAPTTAWPELATRPVDPEGGVPLLVVPEPVEGTPGPPTIAVSGGGDPMAWILDRPALDASAP